jgi:ABC-type transport system substrate-binding protein
MDQAKREAIYLEMQKIVDEEVPMVFVGNITMNYVSVADINPVFQPQGRILPYMATAK